MGFNFFFPFSSTEDHGSFSSLDVLVRPDVAQDSPSSEASSAERESAPGVTKSKARERRREGRSKTFDWAEFRPIAQALAQQRAQEAECLQADGGDRSRRREERRKRYECAASSDHASVTDGGKIDFEGSDSAAHTDSVSPTSLEKHQRVEEVIEEHWRQVEKTPIREERRVPLPTGVQARETTELELLLDSYKQGVGLPGPLSGLVSGSPNRPLATPSNGSHYFMQKFFIPLNHFTQPGQFQNVSSFPAGFTFTNCLK